MPFALELGTFTLEVVTFAQEFFIARITAWRQSVAAAL